MSMSLERVVARGTARGLINGSASPSYEMVISLYKLSEIAAFMPA